MKRAMEVETGMDVRSTDLCTLEVHCAKRGFSLAVSIASVEYPGSRLFHCSF